MKPTDIDSVYCYELCYNKCHRAHYQHDFNNVQSKFHIYATCTVGVCTLINDLDFRGRIIIRT